MTIPLITANTLANHRLAFNALAKSLGFSDAGDINRFIFNCYSKALRKMPPADRPKGAVFMLDPCTSPTVLADVSRLKAHLVKIARDTKQAIYALCLDLSTGLNVVHTPCTEEKSLMSGASWPQGYAQLLSKQSGRCVVWANGVGITIFLGGDTYLETPDVVEELPASVPGTFQALSWDDGAIVFEFARHELNDTTPAGIWRIYTHHILQPKPEKLMSVALGKFLRARLAGYKHHDDEPYIENQGRADVSLHLINGLVYIIEVKWTGRSLSASRALESDVAIQQAVLNNTKKWLTEYGEATFASGTKQLCKYFSTGKYDRAYLTVFDCQAPAAKRKDEFMAINVARVHPHDPERFRIVRACVDPRKASKVAKAI